MARRQATVRPHQVVLFILFFAFAYIAPFVLIVSWLVTEYRASGVRANSAELSQPSSEIAQAHGRIQGLWQSGVASGLELREDQMFDARFREGKVLNAEIGAEQAMLGALEAAQASVIVPLSQRDAMRGALIAWLSVFAFLWFRDPDGVLFWKSVWASAAAICTAALIYFSRKAGYARLPNDFSEA